ncbi:hypothetical protein AVEN_189710-1 [Araneus ventricosus]|uniref:Uncharacterized protein n=1 Tax=Araneus ventricosus TaxID=182803 RepID=A0A4Y2J0T7_ARAVE|nr:hypothetical protein AVEN_189710-1 [Araneus ventricosus]
MDKGQEPTFPTGNEEAMDILPDHSTDAYSSRGSETHTCSKSYLLAARQSENKHSEIDGRVIIDYLHQKIAKMKKKNENLRREVDRKIDAISKENGETDVLRRLKDLVLNTERSETTEELDKVGEQ